VGGPRGFINYPTKRQASIALADCGRACTEAVRRLNAINGVAASCANAWIVQVHPKRLHDYCRARASFDAQLLHIWIHRRCKVPAIGLQKVHALASACRDLIAVGMEIVPLAESFNLKLCANQLAAIEAELERWKEADHGGDAGAGAAGGAAAQEPGQRRHQRSA
jgi:hypothetical protein